MGWKVITMSQNNFLVYQLLFNGKSYYNQSTTPTTKHLIIQDWQVDWHVNLHEEITKFLLAFLVSWLSYKLINGWLYESFCCPPTEDVCTLVSSSLYINGVSSFRCKRNFSLATHVLHRYTNDKLLFYVFLHQLPNLNCFPRCNLSHHFRWW